MANCSQAPSDKAEPATREPEGVIQALSGPLYKVTPAEQLVTVEFGKTVSFREIKAYGEALAKDPLFQPDFSEIVDLTKVEDFRLGADQAMALADIVDPFQPGARRAFIARTELQVHSARLHQLLRNDDTNIRIFDSLPAAQEWLRNERQEGPATFS